MHLKAALSIAEASEIDPDRTLTISHLTLGTEAAREAIRLINEGSPQSEVKIIERQITENFYWQIFRKSLPVGEVFGFPNGTNGGLPTSTELALIRALHSTEPAVQSRLINGGALISVGIQSEIKTATEILLQACRPAHGHSSLWGTSQRFDLLTEDDAYLKPIVVGCICNSFIAAPLKFRFIELYRAIEARFLEDIIIYINQEFAKEPQRVLERSLQRLKAELSQLVALAEQHKNTFEELWDQVASCLPHNSFAKALFKKLDEKGGENKSPKWKAGAAMMYYVRCAIVHAGEKDLVFESFSDGQDVISAIIPSAERASLLLCGINILEE